MNKPQINPAHKTDGHITDVLGIHVGHFTDSRRPTGCSVVLCPDGAVAGVDVRGSAPGTRETDLLAPGNLVEQVHAIMLSGGSAFGLDAASGAMRWLEEHGYGLATPTARVPIVPSAVLFDLLVGDASIRPNADAGYAACQAAALSILHSQTKKIKKTAPSIDKQAPSAATVEGNIGAGAGATVGKIFGLDRAMKAGIGSASLSVGGITVGALIACNALGDIIDPDTAQPIAGARTTARSKKLLDSRRALLRGDPPIPILAGTNTTIGVIATDAILSKIQAHKLAQMAHDGLARSINPVHTLSDGDTLFMLGTGQRPQKIGMMTLAALVSEVTARATLRAALMAESITASGLRLPGLKSY